MTATATLAACVTVHVRGAGVAAVNGAFKARSASQVPEGFARTCRGQGWNVDSTWMQLSDKSLHWYEKEDDSYIYWNRGDGRWWIDGPSGSGLYVSKSTSRVPPTDGWVALPGSKAGAAPHVELEPCPDGPVVQCFTPSIHE
eukprot:gene5097-5190_t